MERITSWLEFPITPDRNSLYQEACVLFELIKKIAVIALRENITSIHADSKISYGTNCRIICEISLENKDKEIMAIGNLSKTIDQTSYDSILNDLRNFGQDLRSIIDLGVRIEGKSIGHVCSQCEKLYISESFKIRETNLCHDCRIKKLSTFPVDGGLVYLLRSSKTGLMKIGYTKHLGKRVRELSNAQGGELRIVDTIPGSKQLERDLQNTLSEYRTQGEWFMNDEKVIEIFLESGEVKISS